MWLVWLASLSQGSCLYLSVLQLQMGYHTRPSITCVLEISTPFLKRVRQVHDPLSDLCSLAVYFKFIIIVVVVVVVVIRM